MAGEGAFASAIASLGGGMDQERDRMRLEARQALQDKLAQQKETDTRNRADFSQSLQAREAGLVPSSEVQGTYDRLSASPLDTAVKSIPLQTVGMGATPTDNGPPAPPVAPPALPAAIEPNNSKLSALGHAADLLSTGARTIMPTSHGQQPMIFDYSQSKDARDAEKENAKQDAITTRMEASKDRDAARLAAAPFTLSAGQVRKDAQGNVIASAPDKPENETWTHENVMLDGKPAIVKTSNRGAYQTLDNQPITTNRITPYVNPTANEGSWEESTLTRNGTPQQRNSKTGVYRDVPAGLSPKDQDNPQQLMQGTRGVQGARMMLLSHQNMVPFEKAAAVDPSKFTGWDQFQAQFANDFNEGKITNLGNAERSAAIVNLNKTNPDLAQYVRNGLYYAFGENELQQRPSDFRTKMSDYLATIGPAMNPAQIGQVSSMREESMRPAVEMAQRLRQRMKLPPDPLFQSYTNGGAVGAQSLDGGGKIDAAHFAQLTPEAQDYFRKQGRAP